jgi:hypothetical protein
VSSSPNLATTGYVIFFYQRSHFTQYKGVISTQLRITASIVQGSAVDAAAYVVDAADSTAQYPGNKLCKYADDT